MEELLNKIQADVKIDKENISNIAKFLTMEALKTAEAFKAIDNNFENINQRLDAITTEVVLLKKISNENLDGFSGKLDGVSGIIDGVSGKVDDVSGKIDDVSGKIDYLTKEVQKIQKVSRYNEEFDNLLKLNKIGIS